MTGTRRGWIALTETALRLLLRLYPRRFRARFSREVLASAREDLAGAATPAALVAASARELGQALAGVIPQHQLEHARDPRPGLTEKTMLLLHTLVTEVRHAARSLLKTPGFTVVALVVLALGIGASTAIFSVVDAVVLRALPFDEHDRLVAVLEHDPARPQTFGAGATTTQNYLDWRAHQQSFEALAATSGWRFRLQNESGEPADAQARRVTPEFFDVLRVAPVLGRAFVAEDETASRKVALLSHAFWQRQFGGASDVVGRRLELNEEPWEIVGVLPRDFSYPVASPQPAEIFVPQFFAADDRSRESGNRSYNFLAIGRLKPGMSVASADGEMKRIAAALALEHPKWYQGRTARVIPLHAQFIGAEVRGWMLMLLGSVAFVLLIACANVANLMLARASERGRELGIRAALGAGRLTLMRGLLVESLVLSTAGTILGVAVGAAGVRMLKAWLPGGLPRTAAIGIDWRVLAAATLAAVGTGVLFGLLPALQSSRPNLSQGLRDGGRSATAGAARRRTRSALVVAEVALATVLLVGAGLFIASFMNLMRVDPGFDYRGVMTPGSVSVPYDRANPTATFARGRIYTNEVIEAIARVPGVEAVAGVQGGLPLSGSWSRTPITLPGKGELKGDDMDIDLRTVTTGYLELLRLPLRAGRYPNDQDRDGAPAVVVVNEAAVRKFWDGRPVVGERLTLNKIERTIIGVVGDIRHLGPEQPVRQEAYVPALQTQVTGVTLVLRTTADPAALLPAVKAAIWSVNPEQRLGSDPGTLEGYFDRLIAQRRFNMTLLALFGVLGVVIAAVGIYGVIGYLVSQRTTEFGVRMALGATRAALVAMVLRQAGGLLATGLVLGAGVAWWFSSAANAFLFQLDGADVRVFASALGVLAVAGLVASAVPARRAARVDPLAALRAD